MAYTGLFGRSNVIGIALEEVTGCALASAWASVSDRPSVNGVLLGGTNDCTAVWDTPSL
jgi:hypothetical protein